MWLGAKTSKVVGKVEWSVEKLGQDGAKSGLTRTPS